MTPIERGQREVSRATQPPASDAATPNEADYEAASPWIFVHPDNYEGDYAEDLALAFAEHRCATTRTADEGALVEAWQTMETAPKDGSWFLACGGIYNGLPFCARYDNRFADGDCWEVKFNGRPMRHCVQYWKPLPTMPPTLTAHGKGE